jgi:hypothetical protein
MLRKIALAISASVIVALGAIGAAANMAGATTLTCTNIAGATTGHLGCGGLQLAYNAKGTLDIAADSNTQNAVVRVQPDSLGNPNEDFTAFAVSGHEYGSVGNLGRYVAMFTPDGVIPQYSTSGPGGPFVTGVPAPGAGFWAGPNTHCISIVSENNGPVVNGHHLARWNVVLRNCTDGEFTYGTGALPGTVTAGFGNQYQEWAPVAQGSNLELVNVWLHNHKNVDYALNDAGFGGAGTHLIAYPDQGSTTNEQFTLLGCTAPSTTLSGGSYNFCP